MIRLPEDQDKLLKELNVIDSQDRLGIRPERNNINLFLVVLIWLFGIIASIFFILSKQSEYISQIFGLCVAISIGLIASFYNKTWGFYWACLFALIFDGYINYQYDPTYISAVTTLADGLTVFIISNQFGRKGLIAASILVISKLTFLFFSYSDTSRTDDYLASVINILTIGSIPVLLSSISQFSRKARKQEIRAAILSLQNQDLLSSWQDFYKGAEQILNEPDTTKASTAIVSNTTPQEKTPIAEPIPYTSPYMTRSTNDNV
jgi:hypothetical protein